MPLMSPTWLEYSAILKQANAFGSEETLVRSTNFRFLRTKQTAFHLFECEQKSHADKDVEQKHDS